MTQLLRDGGNLAPHLGADVALDEVVDLVETDQRAEGRLGEPDSRIYEELLREFDDGAVCATDVFARATLRTEPGDHLDDEVDLVGQQRVQVDEAVARELGQLDLRGEARVLGQAPSVLVENFAEHRLCGGVLREHAATRDLGDVGRLEVNLEREAIHQASEFDLLVVEPADELAEVLLRSNDDPVLATALHAQALHDGLKVQHLLHVARDELAHFIDDEY